jgi:hypothetical protein
MLLGKNGFNTAMTGTNSSAFRKSESRLKAGAAKENWHSPPLWSRLEWNHFRAALIREGLGGARRWMRNVVDILDRIARADILWVLWVYFAVPDCILMVV